MPCSVAFNDARASGVSALPQLRDVAVKSSIVTRQVAESRTSSTRLLTGLQSTGERAERALALLCQALGASSGHLYLSRRDGLVLASSIPEAFAERGDVFAIAYVSMQIGRTAFFLWAIRNAPDHGRLSHSATKSARLP